MAKQGQHKHDINDQRISKGHNNPHLSQPLTAGPYKKPETYRKQAAEHKATNKPAQMGRNEWKDDTREQPGGKARKRPRPTRSGSDSNASSSTRGH